MKKLWKAAIMILNVLFVPNIVKIPIQVWAYCPQSFSGGGLYLKVKWLLWSVKNGLLWYMGHTSMSQFHTGWWHFWRLAVSVDYDGVSTKIYDYLNDWAWYMGHTSMSQFSTGWSHFSRLMVTIDYDGVSTKIDDNLSDWAWYMDHTSRAVKLAALSRNPENLKKLSLNAYSQIATNRVKNVVFKAYLTTLVNKIGNFFDSQRV